MIGTTIVAADDLFTEGVGAVVVVVDGAVVAVVNGVAVLLVVLSMPRSWLFLSAPQETTTTIGPTPKLPPQRRSGFPT